MNEDDYFMSDTLNDFSFTDVKSQLNTRDSLSKEISFDDSSFLEKLSIDFENIEEQNCIKSDRTEVNKVEVLEQRDDSVKHERHSSSNLDIHNDRNVLDACNSVQEHNIPKQLSPGCKQTRSKNITNEYKQSDKSVCKKVTPSSTKEPVQLVRDIATSLGSDFDENTNFKTVDSTDTILKVNNNYELSAWGLPDIVLEKYASRKIKSMFSWQFECLSNQKVLNDLSNLIYSAPTSAGKTLVAEIISLKTIFERKKKVIFILPFVSIVREKMYYFQDILGSSGIRAEGFMGSYNPPGGFSSIDFAICTIEKANSLINRLLEEGRLSEVGCILVDEMHLLGDPHRGYLLELLLTKIRYISLKDTSVQIQIVGMSATLPNLDQLAKWLGAELFSTSFRPIPLYEQASICGDIYDKEFKLIRKLQPLPDIDVDTDNILQLCLETIKESCSVLIFCPTKNWCENLAQQLSLAFFKIGNTATNLGEVLRSQVKSDLILEVLEQLKFCPVSLDPILKRTVSFGIAFHHAGLTMDERDIIEGAFRSGAVKILVATSTLSSGVNLPARRVLIRSPNFCGKPLDLLTYRQMIGRAGRMGKDIKGESILICQKNDSKIAKELMSNQLPAIQSCLEGSGKLKRAILEVVASGVASSPDDITLFTNCTLLAVTNSQLNNLQDPIGEAVEFLKSHEFIRLQKTERDEKYLATSLGKACLSSSIAPDEGLALFTELEKARQCFVLETELHLIYLVTPYSACYSWGNMDWMLFLDLWEKLPPAMKRVGELVGVRISYIINATRGKIDSSSSKAYHKMLVHKRFFVALALQDLVNEVPLGDVCSKFNCNRGMLQSLQQSASTFAGMVTSFSRQLGWTSVEILLAQFQDRMQFGVSRDLLDLMRLPSLNGKLARTLYNAGIETLVQLANNNIDTVENILCRAGPFESSKERESESEYENKKRNKLRTVWVTGKEGLTEREAAALLVRDARNYLKIEMGLKEARWDSQSGNNELENVISQTQKDKNSQIISPNNIKTNVASLGMTSNVLSKSMGSVQQSEKLKDMPCSVSISSDKCTRKTNEIAEYNKQFLDMKVAAPEIEPCNKKLSPNVSKNKSLDLNISETSSLFSNTSFPQVEDNLQISNKSESLESKQTDLIETNKPCDVSDILNNSPMELNISESSVFGSLGNKKVSLNNTKSDKSTTDDSFLLHLSSESTGEKIKSSFSESFDEFETEGNFETAIQNIEISQEIEKHNANNLIKHENIDTKKRKIDVAKRNTGVGSDSSSEDSFLEATPKKKLRVGELRTPFSSTIKKLSQLNVEDEPFNENVDFSKLQIVQVCTNQFLIDTFFDELRSKISLSFCVLCAKISENKPTIGANVFDNKNSENPSSIQLHFKDKRVEGFAFCWGGTVSYFLSIENIKICERILIILENIFTDEQKSVRMFDAKEQIKILRQCCNIEFFCKIEDPKVADWLLDAEGREKSLQTMINCYCKDLNDIGKLCGKINAVGSLGSNLISTSDPKLTASVEAVATWHLVDALKKELVSEMPKCNRINFAGFPTNYDLEMRTLLCLANMEYVGMSVSKTSLQRLVDLLKDQQNSIERKAYSLAGRRFNFISSTDVSKVIGMFKGKKISTRKQVLEQNDHPISNLVLLWRKINFTLSKTIYPLLKSCENNRIHASYVSHTATGRITMHEPNIQMVTKDFSIVNPVTKEEVLISCRSAFSVPEEYILVSADYCQLELRILTYLSKDKLLTDIMGKPGDIFKSVAARWNNVNEEMVTETMRQNAKQLCYGIIYGMGARTLAEQLEISEDDAIHFMESFRNTYSGIKDFIKKTVNLCRQHGYVETVTGRRRYLPHINHPDSSMKNQAERQAVNTTVQGSAADIVKNAMITIEDKINIVFKKSRYKPKLTLHLHDELIYEVPEKYIDKTVKIIKRGMENSASLFGRFPVKVKTGKSWGQLVEYQVENI